MAANTTRQIFVNIAVRDVKRSMEFFTKLGFEFNPKFTDDNAACLIINDHASVMLLKEPLFKTFTQKGNLRQRAHRKPARNLLRRSH